MTHLMWWFLLKSSKEQALKNITNTMTHEFSLNYSCGLFGEPSLRTAPNGARKRLLAIVHCFLAAVQMNTISKGVVMFGVMVEFSWIFFAVLAFSISWQSLKNSRCNINFFFLNSQPWFLSFLCYIETLCLCQQLCKFSLVPLPSWGKPNVNVSIYKNTLTPKFWKSPL